MESNTGTNFDSKFEIPTNFFKTVGKVISSGIARHMENYNVASQTLGLT